VGKWFSYFFSFQAKLGFLSSTYSFNLPVPAGASAAVIEQLAQQFVDVLCTAKGYFLPSYSFASSLSPLSSPLSS
jgi:aminoglycoside N3'-acetyltransferase